MELQDAISIIRESMVDSAMGLTSVEGEKYHFMSSVINDILVLVTYAPIPSLPDNSDETAKIVRDYLTVQKDNTNNPMYNPTVFLSGDVLTVGEVICAELYIPLFVIPSRLNVSDLEQSIDVSVALSFVNNAHRFM